MGSTTCRSPRRRAASATRAGSTASCSASASSRSRRRSAQELHVGVADDFAPARKAHPGLRVGSDGALEALAGALTAAGAAVEWDDRIEGRRRFFTSDPWGNRLELLAP